MDIFTYAIVKKYVNECLVGMGALKGAPCTVKATEVTDAGLKVIFEWKDNNGTSHTTETIIPAGPQGEQGVPGAQGASGRGILTIEKTDT